MKVKILSRDIAGAEADSEPPQIPGKFVCIDPAQEHLIYDFLTDFNQDTKESALIHLRLCLHCRELAKAMLEIKSGHCLHAEKELTSAAANISCAADGECESWGEVGEGDKEIDSYA
jgi:hypothetical protein